LGSVVKAISKPGGAGILYWASPDSIRAMLDTALGKQLRQAETRQVSFSPIRQ
jgi:hypothetical protein